MTPIDPKLSEGARDRAAYSGADAAAQNIAHRTGNDDDLARSGKLAFPGTSLGAKCDLEGVQDLPRLPEYSATTQDGHTFSRSPNSQSEPNADAAPRQNYAVDVHDRVTQQLADQQYKSGSGNGVTSIPKV